MSTTLQVCTSSPDGMTGSRGSAEQTQPGSLGNHAAPRLYEYSLEECKQDTLNILPREFRVQWREEDAVPAEIRHAWEGPLLAAETNGNGSCALHAVFGRPSAARELFATGARDLAVAALAAIAI